MHILCAFQRRVFFVLGFFSSLAFQEAALENTLLTVQTCVQKLPEVLSAFQPFYSMCFMTQSFCSLFFFKENSNIGLLGLTETLQVDPLSNFD